MKTSSNVKSSDKKNSKAKIDEKKSSPIKSIVALRPKKEGNKNFKNSKRNVKDSELKDKDQYPSEVTNIEGKQPKPLTNSNKELAEEELLFSGVSLDKPIWFYKPSDRDLVEYSQELEKRNDINFSLNIFLSQKYNEDNKKTLIADLRDMEISAAKGEKKFNLKGANFRGAIFKNTRFVNCDLTDSFFSDSWLRGVLFRYCILTHADFRGCNLEDCRFGHEYVEPEFSESKNIKFSLSLSEFRIFADIKNEIAKKNEEQRILDAKRYEMREISKNISIFKKIQWFFGMRVDHAQYKKVMADLKKMEQGKFSKKYIVHQSAENLINNNLCSFYPVFAKNFKDMNKIIRKKYVRLSRSDLEEFTATTDKQVTVSLNEFAQQKYLATQEPGATIPPDTKIIADLSSKVNQFGNNEWNRVNLSGISFVKRDMSFVNFAGTDLSKCNFSASNLHGANLDCCNLVDCVFTASNLTDCSMINVDLNNAILEDVTLLRSNLSWSNLVKVRIIDSNISYINFHNSNLYKSYFENVIVDGSNFDLTCLQKSKFSKSSFRNTSFVHSKWSSIKMDQVLFNGSVFNHAEMKNSLWDKVELKDVEAMCVDLTESKFSEGSVIENSNFRNSVFDAVRISLCKITNSDFDYAKVAYGKFGGVDFSKCHFRFSDFDNVAFSECNAESTDFSGAKMFNTRLVKTNFRGSDFSGVKITDSDLTGASFENAIWYSSAIISSIVEGVNNHRVRINDSTFIDKCIIKKLEGQFYHYDRDDFMEIMFIEQQQAHQRFIRNAIKVNNMGGILYIKQFFEDDLKISKKDRDNIVKSRHKNRINLKNHYQQIRDNPLKKFVDMDELYIKNLIASHNV